MKRMLILMLAAMILCASGALAEVPDEMRIVNCQEWVSLRAEPDSATQRFAEVPLGATVRGFYQSNGEFTQCEYDGVVGYILTQYLEVTAAGSEQQDQPVGDAGYELAMENGCVRVWQGMGYVSETLYAARYDANGQLLWSYATESLGSTELESVSAFINDKAETPMVMVYNSYYGLIALNAETGEKIWTLPCTQVSLGGSIKYAVGDDGAMYIGGYYGPDPVAISADGKVLYQCSSLHEDAEFGETTFYWLSEIAVQADGITARYVNGDAPVKATFDASGAMVSWEAE